NQNPSLSVLRCFQTKKAQQQYDCAKGEIEKVMKRLLSLVMASFLFLSFLPEIASANSAESLVKTARSYLGVPYSYGGTTTKGIDCSAYTRLVLKESGAPSLPRTS